MMRIFRNRKVQISCCLLLCLALYIVWDFEVRKNFHTVVEGKLYRSGQPSRDQLAIWIKRYHLKTIIVLKPTLEPYEQEIAERYGVTLHHIEVSTRSRPSEEQWKLIKALLTDEQNMPLLYHCLSGADKTGLVTAMYRIEVQHWPLWKALLEMDLRYHIPLNRPVLQRFLMDRYGKDPDAEKPPEGK